MSISSAPRIKKLDETVVNRIAAGEVVQRPSSAIKELLENSLDAGATSISVVIKGGGLAMMQITDNGHGIRKDDLDIVCERFTTSKLSTFDDLRKIATFGFRGEALASITHVAHVQILTRTPDSACAYRAKYSDGKLIPFSAGEKAEPKPSAGVGGTTITIEDLFYNMQTRKQAFKNSNEEYLKILDVLTKYSIRYGDERISFTCKKHGQMVPDLHTSSTGSTLENIKVAYGASVAKELIDVSYHCDASDSSLLSCAFTGKISNANYSNKKPIYILFINNRLVESSAIRKVVESVYHEILPKHTHPFVYLSISMPAQNVDVNVHPTKKEVHFLYEDEFLERLYSQISEKLLHANESRSFQVKTIVPLVTTDVECVEGINPVSMDTSKVLEKRDLEPTSFDAESKRDTAKDSDRHHSFDLNDSERAVPESPNPKTFSSSFSFSNFKENSQKGFESSYLSSSSAAKRKFQPSDSQSHQGKRENATSIEKTKGSSSIAPSKLIRVDPTLQKIQSFFQPSSAANISQQPQEVNSQTMTDDVGEPKDNANECYCFEINSTQIALGSGSNSSNLTCSCCTAVQLDRSRALSAQTSTLKTVSATAAFLPEIKKTSCQFHSIHGLLKEIERNFDPSLESLLKNQSFVGAVDVDFSLAQYGTKLMLLDHSLLLQQLFYQLCIMQFGEVPKIEITNPITIKDFIVAALASDSIEWNVNDESRSAVSIVDASVSLLIEKADMLKEYFGIEISSSGQLVALPNLLNGYKPQPEFLPEFLLLLATETNWSDEVLCFKSVATRIADYYARLQWKQEFVETSSVSITQSLSDDAVFQLEHLLFPALRKHFKATSGLFGTAAVVEIAALEHLYKIFERC